MNGSITEIQRFSLNDGPGIRTTVFFKGCNMRCAWCHNPETIGNACGILFHPGKCIGCFKCIKVCGSLAHKKRDGAHRFYPKLCIKCGKCAKVCFAGAMCAAGRGVGVEEVMREILQDAPYYHDSGGGVTLSGGEVLCQPEFAEELVKACHDSKIKVAVETNLNFPFERIEPILRKLDLVVFDIKIFDSAEHRRWTGVDNAAILDSARRLSRTGVPLIVRTPLIPGATDSDDNLKAIASFISELENIQCYELLNFNPLGAAKYEGLGMDNPFLKARPLAKSRLDEIMKILSGFKVPVKIG